MARANRQFVEDTENKLGFKSHGCKVVERNNQFELKQPYAPYNIHIGTEKDLLRFENTHFLDENII